MRPTASADTLWVLASDPGNDAVRESDDENSLVARYGAVNVTREHVGHADGMRIPGTVLFAADTLRRLEIEWSDTVAYRQPRVVTVVGGAGTVYPGIRFGMTLKELEQLNGRPFELSGFGGHSAGTVTDWRGGRLAAVTAATAGGESRLTLRLQAEPPYAPGADIDPYESENLFLSSDPGIQLLNPRVVVIVVQPR